MPTWLFLATLLAGMGGATLMAWRGDLAAAFAIVLVTLSAQVGFRMGLSTMMLSVGAIVAVVSLVPFLAFGYESRFSEYVHTTGLTNRLACMAAFTLLVSLVVMMLGTMVINRILFRLPRLKRLNAYLGFAAGAIEGGVLVLLLFGALLTLQLAFREIDAEENRVTALVDAWAARARASVLGNTVRDYNPFDRWAALAPLRGMPEMAGRIGDPDYLQRLLRDPDVVAAADDAEVAEALREIKQEPYVRDVLDGNEPIDGRFLKHLMDSPAVLQLVDLPAFRSSVRRLYWIAERRDDDASR